MVVLVLLLALLVQLTCATHSGWNLPKRNSKKSFLEDAMKEMDGIESLTKPQRIPPRVIKVLIGPEHLRHHRHRHRHHHHHHFFNQNGHFSFPPRPTRPHINIVKGSDREKNRTSKLVHDAAFLRQAVRLLVDIKKNLNSSSVKKAKETHLKRNKTSERPEVGALTEYSISMLPEIRSIVQRDKDNTGQARAAFAKARQIIDKTHSLVHPAAPPITERVQNDKNITKEAKISSAVAVLEDAVQKAAQFHTAKAGRQETGTTGKAKAPEGQNQQAKGMNTSGMNTTVTHRTLLSVLENIKRNLTHREGDYVAKFGRVITHLRSLSNNISSATINATARTKQVLIGKSKESGEISTNKTLLDIEEKPANQSGSVLKEVVSKNKSNNSKTAVVKQHTETQNELLQYKNVASGHGNGLAHHNRSVVKEHDNNNNRTTALDHYAESLANVLQHKSIASNQGSRLVSQNEPVVKDPNNSSSSSSSSSNNSNNNNNSSSSSSSNSSNNSSTALQHLAESLTKILQHTSVTSNNSNATRLNARNPKVVTGEAKYLLASGPQENHTAGPKLPKQRLASRKAFGLAMKLVKAAIAREELRKAEKELFSKMKEMMNKTAETANANQGSIQSEKSTQDASNPNADSNSNNKPVSTGGAPNVATSTAKNKKQDSESQAKYNEAAHLEEKIAAQQDKMYDDLVNHILDNDDGDEDEEGDEEGTTRELSRQQNEDYGDFKDSDEEMNERAYGSKVGDTSRYTLRNVVLKPKTISSSVQSRGGEHKNNKVMNTQKSKRPKTVKKRHKVNIHGAETSADYGTIQIHEDMLQDSRKRNYRPVQSKQQKGEKMRARKKTTPQKLKFTTKRSKSNT